MRFLHGNGDPSPGQTDLDEIDEEDLGTGDE